MIIGINGKIREAFELRFAIAIATKISEMKNRILFVLDKINGASNAVIAKGYVQKVPNPELGMI